MLLPARALSPSVALLLIAAAGCTATDADGDGVVDDLDCAPDDATIFPGAAEDPTDSIDSNCDGSTTDGGTGDDDDDSVGDDDDNADPGDLDAADPVTGDWSCKGTFTVLPTPGETGVLAGTVIDFESDEFVPGAHVALWPDNDPQTGLDDAEDYLTAADGTFSAADGLIQACVPFAARVWTEFDPPETYPTYEINMMVAGSPPWNEDFNSVAFSTYNLLPLTVGVEPEVGKGIAAGRITDCVGANVANAEISVGSVDFATGTVTGAEGYSSRYFFDESPDGSQMHTSDDGLFGAMNTPPGEDWTLLVWGIPQDEAHCEVTAAGAAIRPAANKAMCLLALTDIYVIPDSVNISNIPLKPWPDLCIPQIDG